MLYEFKCRATGTVTMTESVGRKIVELMGKSPGPKGIITVDQMPAAIKALRSAAERDRKATEAARRGTPAGAAVPAAAKDDDAKEEEKNAVGISQRVVPLIEMLEAAHAAGRDVTWGV
ncbi:MAG: DUF1840 domain-containing protein [Burkholderiaceae bacterium]|jgi:hypothetical protein